MDSNSLEFGIFDWIETKDGPAADVYDRKLRFVEAADKAGIYGWHIAEHVGAPIAYDVSPNVMLSAAIQRTRNIHFGGLIWALPWYDPYRFYREICMLDHMSRGRIELATGRGASHIEAAFQGIHSIEESRERYEEALTIFRAAAVNEVLDFEGKYHSYKGLEVFNHPYQKPYPPLWYVLGHGDIEFHARHGYNMFVPGPAQRLRGVYEQYREIWDRHKDDPNRHNAHVGTPRLSTGFLHTVVADTDAEAEKLWLNAYNDWHTRVNYQFDVRGEPSLLGDISAKVIQERGLAVAGSPDTVAQQLSEMVKTATVDYVLVVLCFGNLTEEQEMHSLDLFTQRVMPEVRKAAAAGAAA